MSTRSPAIMTNGADAVAQVAAALIANDKTRLPNDATADPVAAVLAAKARDRLAKDRAATTEKIAKALQTIDTIKLAPAHDVVHRAVRASLHADAVKAASATEHHEKITAERGARLARKSYEDEHPNAARYRAWGFTINLALCLLASGEVGFGAYMLSEVTEAFPSDLAAAAFLACVVGTLYEAGYLAGGLIARSTKTSVTEFLRRSGIVLLSVLAIVIAITLGMIRANLPVSPDSFLIMLSDLTTYMPAFALMTVEGAFFLIVTSLTASRKFAGDNRDFHLIVVADDASRKAAGATREAIIHKVSDGVARYRKEILAFAKAASAASIKATEIMAEVEAVLRAELEAHNLIVRATAQTFRQAVLAAHRDIATSGHAPLGAPDFEIQFATLIPIEMQHDKLTSRLRRQALRIKVRAMRTERLAAQALSKLDDIMSSVASETYQQ